MIHLFILAWKNGLLAELIQIKLLIFLNTAGKQMLPCIQIILNVSNVKRE